MLLAGHRRQHGDVGVSAQAEDVAHAASFEVADELLGNGWVGRAHCSGAPVDVVDRIDPPHRRHRLTFLVGVGEDSGESRGDEHGVAEVARKTDLAEDRGDRSVDVDRHRPADAPCQAGLDRQGGGHVVAGDTGLAGDREETVESGIAVLVLAMPEPRDPPTVRPPGRDQLVGRLRHADAGRLGPFEDGGDLAHRRLHGGAMELAEGQQPGRRRGRKGGASGDRRAGGEHRRRSCTVVDARHHHGVDQPGGRRIRQVPGVEQVEDRRERHRADQLGEVVAADRDAVGGGRRQCCRPCRRASGVQLPGFDMGTKRLY